MKKFLEFAGPSRLAATISDKIWIVSHKIASGHKRDQIQNYRFGIQPSSRICLIATSLLSLLQNQSFVVFQFHQQMGRPCVRRTSNYFHWIVTSELDLSPSEVINKPKLIKGEGYSYMESGFLLSDPKEDTHLSFVFEEEVYAFTIGSLTASLLVKYQDEDFPWKVAWY